jgi:fructokinase
MNSNNMGTFHCLGEVLWDIFPDKKKAGGAPFNVGFHLHQFGVPVVVHSALGNDPLGNELREHIRKSGLSTANIYQRNKSTGTVLVNTSNKHEVRYTITEDCAWDYLETPKHKIDVNDTLVFGSLAMRAAHNRSILESWLQTPAFKAFDMNLRWPFVDGDWIKNTLAKVNLLKVNEEELTYTQELFGIAGDAQDCFTFLQRNMGIEHLIVTRGSHGSLWLSANGQVKSARYSVDVVDTVGAGDAFLAGLLHGLQSNKPAKDILDTAAALGAFVASNAGATPPWSLEMLTHFISNRR